MIQEFNKSKESKEENKLPDFRQVKENHFELTPATLFELETLYIKKETPCPFHLKVAEDPVFTSKQEKLDAYLSQSEEDYYKNFDKQKRVLDPIWKINNIKTYDLDDDEDYDQKTAILDNQRFLQLAGKDSMDVECRPKFVSRAPRKFESKPRIRQSALSFEDNEL